MTYEEALAKAKELVGNAKEVVIVTHTQPTMDSMGGSLALMLGISSLGKKATVVCPDPMTVNLSGFIGVDRVVKDFGKKNFVVSLDYEDGSIEKVSYNIEGKKFNLVIEHRPGFAPLTQDKVQYTYQGVVADLIISVDTLDFSQMGPVYEQQKDVFAGVPIINVDFHKDNVNYGAINLVDPGASSTTELVAELLATLGVKLTADIGTNLLNAVYDATDNFRHNNVTSMAFEVASVCLKAGAKRFGMPEPVKATEEPKVFVNNQPIVSGGASPAAHAEPEARPIETPIAPSAPQGAEQAASPPVPPSDWLKPKIFKSSTLL